MSADLPPPAVVPRARGPFAVARNVIVFLVALACAASVLKALSPFPSLGNLTRKHAHIARHGGDYDVIYFGSSRVYHEFMPATFDRAAGERGHAVRSFNFGQDGMWPPESFYMLREVLALRPPRLRWVLVDLMDIRPELEGNEETLRAIYWHDLPHTWMAWRHIAEREGEKWTPGAKAAAMWRHAELFLRRGTSLGAGHERLEVALRLREAKNLRRPENEGYEPGEPGPLRGAERAEFLAETARLKNGIPPRPMPPSLRDAVAGVIADVRGAGAELVFIVASNLYGREQFTDWPPPGVRVIAFDDPARYPQLYDPDLRRDPHHLDPAGAEIFSRLLAERFADMLEARR